MASLLHLDSSAHRSEESVSRQLTALFARTWRARHGSTGYRYRDLAADPVAPLDSAYCALGRRLERRGLVPLAKVAAETETPDEEHTWALTRPLVEEVLAADTVLIGSAMYNYSVSGLLKAWIDRVSFPGAFTDPDSGRSLLRNTRVVVVSACGGSYTAGAGRGDMDFEARYLRAYLGKQGVREQNTHVVRAELTISTVLPRMEHLRPLAARSLDAARSQVTALAEAG